MEHPMVDGPISISQLLALYPQISRLFMRLRVDCIGCSLNRFCTISDLCESYNLDHASVRDQIMLAIV